MKTINYSEGLARVDGRLEIVGVIYFRCKVCKKEAYMATVLGDSGQWFRNARKMRLCCGVVEERKPVFHFPGPDFITVIKWNKDPVP